MQTKIILLSLLISYMFSSQAQSLDYKYQSIFIYNFTKNIKWPQKDESDHLTIGILANNKVASEMTAFFSNKTVNARKIIVKNVSTVEAIDFTHVLFIPASNKNLLPAALEKIGTRATLIITEKEGAALQGSIINFIVTPEGKYKFEINQQAASKHNLVIGKELTSLAILI